MEHQPSVRFLNAYNKLDGFMRERLGKATGPGYIHVLKAFAEKEPTVRDHLYELETYARLRNAIVHNPASADIQPIAEPHEDVVENYERLVEQVLRPPLALAVAVTRGRICFASWAESAVALVTEMHLRGYTHVPVLEDGRVVGVFSDYTLSCAVAAQRAITVDQTTQVSDFKEFVPFSKHSGEVFAFASPAATVPEVVEMFRRTCKQNLRLGAVFLTENGTAADTLLALLTAWDIAGRDLLRL